MNTFVPMLDVLLVVIEQTRIPETMFTFGSVMKIASISTIPLIQTVQHILGSMGMNNVQEDVKSILMSHINQSF